MLLFSRVIARSARSRNLPKQSITCADSTQILIKQRVTFSHRLPRLQPYGAPRNDSEKKTTSIRKLHSHALLEKGGKFCEIA